MKDSHLLLGPIIGGLSHDRVNLWGRSSETGILYAWIGNKPDLSDAVLAGNSIQLIKEDAFAGIVPLTGLQPNTRYYYSLSLRNDSPDPGHAPYPSFMTFPLPGERHSFSFTFGSCFRPTGLEAGKIFNTIDVHRQNDNLRFIMMLGDQIYADLWEHNGIDKIAITVDDYRRVYEYAWSRPPLKNLFKNLPVFMTLDDHEVDDDWAWEDESRRWASIPIWGQLFRRQKRRPKDELFITIHRIRDALEAYWEHQGMHAPACINPPKMDRSNRFLFHEDETGSLAYTFNYGAAAFFVMDTRTMRVRGRNPSLLGKTQWEALEHWLLEDKNSSPVKFIASSSSVLFDMAIDFARDRWNGFKRDRERLLNFIASNGIKNVYLLVGDLHSAHAISADLRRPDNVPVKLWEFCSTPFEQSTNSAAFTYIRPRSKSIKKQKLHFSLQEPNYGVVSVDFPPESNPQVQFSVFNIKGDLIKSIDANQG